MLGPFQQGMGVDTKALVFKLFSKGLSEKVASSEQSFWYHLQVQPHLLSGMYFDVL